MCRYIAGQSIREIAREESRGRATVTKIFRSEEMNTFVHRMRERLYGLGCDALAAVEHELRVRRNGRLAYQLLTDIGAVPPPQEKLEIGCQTVKIDRAELTPFEIAMADDENGNVSHVAYGAACAIEESAANYGFPLPTPKEVHHRRRVATVADEITGGRFHEICMNGGAEEKRVPQLGEQMTKSEESLRLHLLSCFRRVFSQLSRPSLGEKGSSAPTRLQARFGKPSK